MSARFDRQLSGATTDQTAPITVPHHDRDRIGRIKRRYELPLDGLAQALTTLRSRVLELEARNRELAGELSELQQESRRHPRQIAALGGTVTLASRPGQGTVLMMTLPWPRRAPGRDMPPVLTDHQLIRGRLVKRRDWVRDFSNVT